MKKRILLIVVCIILIAVVICVMQIYRIFKRIDQGKQFPLYIEEGEVIDFNAVNEERIVDGRKRLWFDALKDKERKRLADYMEKNNYKIAPGSYGIYYGSKLEDLKKELIFVKIDNNPTTAET